MKLLLRFIVTISLLIFASSCSDFTTTTSPVATRGIHPEGWANSASVNFHGQYLRENNFDLQTCKSCHAADYTGGITDVSCYTCHTSAEGPEACNTCHGDFADTTGLRYAPPRAVNGDTSETYRGVGAHLSHTFDNHLRDNIDCSACHVVPQSVNSPGHIDNTPHAEVIVTNLRLTPGDTPYYDYDSLKCYNVYCHGNFQFQKDSSSYTFIYTDSLITGNNFSPKWTQLDESQGECGTCHDLPPKGHLDAGTDPTASTCGNCHTGIVDANGEIIDKSKHINGKKNVFGN